MSTAPPRTPKFTRFIATGALLGFVVGLAIAVASDPAPSYSSGAEIGYLGVLCAGVGALLAGVVAVLVDRRG